MPEWAQYVRPHLAGLRLDPVREAEIVDEVSQHLDLRYEETLALTEPVRPRHNAS